MSAFPVYVVFYCGCYDADVVAWLFESRSFFRCNTFETMKRTMRAKEPANKM